MKLVATLVTGAFSLAVSVQAGDCTAGMNYCADVLNDINYQKYNSQILAAKYSSVGSGAVDVVNYLNPLSPAGFLFHCEANGDITLQEICAVGCVNAGAGNNDYCRWGV
ncbi:hypothetical protein AtubIFM55763_005464 [Aspergillus tubingensis]|uniref:Uncharacterized protein n=2 Tax=Aspergillus subgen. Circumdati TaxID=2720871 RepID=A0A100IPX9_ASPNG|nr:hypothetical protein AKAW_06119 [Aspergillus niger]GLA60058.1 hypothetical protein AtubIFM54640_011484 [Aspergillus tubingensis]GLA68721.1 hypothetical protein AtubIFM55763_005464 [Aspergillus tubingensis]GLA79361.1 hypothetical protein AtubIFM56815_000155 [Aspergillus tubingensis]GLA98966.1 hypothetical protein AtubIFM57143_007265 [Aspergillus tubingensis]